MASAARRAQRSGDHPGDDLDHRSAAADDDPGERRLVARSSTARPARPAARAPFGPIPATRGAAGVVDRLRVWRADRASHRAERPNWRTRWGLDSRQLRTLLVAGTAGVVVILAAGVGLGLAARPTTRAATRGVGAGHGGAGASTSSPNGATGSTGKPASGGSGGAPATSPPSTAVAPSPTGAPRISSASPASGHAGQTVVVDGSALFSGDGEVVAYFGGTQAPTSCTTRSACHITVPDLGAGPARVRLTVVTTSGRSNALPFTYS
jgi:IPT/TIG domain